ncbi:TetR/AcrR family transcriptional regulator [Sphingomonas sp. GlSt437]|uniref:TetR/AcrR family transcriptional regulator n=1 Tax=Sphingomonas sp. GlSt437 TaxID=3389970 RepID=UPI003A87653D
MKADVRREALLARLVDHVLEHGIGSASLRPLALAAGTSDRMLIYYFEDKAGLIAAILTTGAARMAAMLDALAGPERRDEATLATLLHQQVLGERFWPFMQLWLEIAALAARGDTACKATGEAIGRGFVDWIDARLAIDDADARRATAERLLAELDARALLTALGLSDIAARLAR